MRSAEKLAMLLFALLPGVSAGQDAAEEFIRRMDALPPEQRLPHWDQTKALMSRAAPAVGDPAPDFTLPTQDGAAEITLSAFHPDRPRVLIFGSFT